jgi:predicted amidohydrolase YtcJ
MHLLLFGANLLKISLTDCKNLEDVKDTIRRGAKERPGAERLLCSGWMHSMTNGQALASMLDDIDPRPIFINSKDLHSVWCNTAALKELQVQDTPDPEGGKIWRDEQGNPSGLLDEAAAIKIVWAHTAKVTGHEENVRYIREAIKAYNAHGYTGVIELATDAEIWALLKQIRDEQEVPLRFAAHWLITPSTSDEENLAQVDEAIRLHQEFNLETSPDFRIAGIKIIGDGVIDACTASLREPYLSTGTNCSPIWTAEKLTPVVKKASDAGLIVAIHAIGDETVRLAVDTLEKHASRGGRHRVEHLELTRPEDSRRLGELGITASIQPVHSDPAILQAWNSLLGERRSRAFAYSEFLEHGAPIAIGTDSPTAPHLPLSNIYVATTRKSAREPNANLEPVNQHFKISLSQALSAATYGSAYACFAEQRVGSLEIGKIADFVILDMKWSSEALLEAKVAETYFAGSRVFP